MLELSESEFCVANCTSRLLQSVVVMDESLNAHLALTTRVKFKRGKEVMRAFDQVPSIVMALDVSNNGKVAKLEQDFQE